MADDIRAPGITAQLSAFASGLTPEDVPEQVRAMVRQSLSDQIGVILAAGTLGSDCRQIVDLARASGGSGARILGHGVEVSPAFAAFANGAMAHALDFEETHDSTLVHPSAAVVPAALAVAGITNASGADLLTALTVGSEVSCRIAASFVGDPQADNRFFVLPLVGVFGAAAAAGRLLGLTPDQMEQAFALAMSQVMGSAAVLSDPHSSFREIRDGFNAKGGVIAAQMAARGVRGFAQPFESENGYYALFQGGKVNPAAFDGLGTAFEAGNVSYKPWPACRGAHVFIEAALDLATAHALTPDVIDRVEVEVSPFFTTLCEPPALRRAPTSATVAKFSIPYSVALALVDGKVTLDSFGPEQRSDPALLAMAARVQHRTVDLPQNQATRGYLTIITKDGQVLKVGHDLPLGHPSRPMDAAALAAKFRMCAAQAVCPPDAETLDLVQARIGALETITDVSRDIIALM